jgi:hypothetical protein
LIELVLELLAAASFLTRGLLWLLRIVLYQIGQLLLLLLLEVVFLSILRGLRYNLLSRCHLIKEFIQGRFCLVVHRGDRVRTIIQNHGLVFLVLGQGKIILLEVLHIQGGR